MNMKVSIASFCLGVLMFVSCSKDSNTPTLLSASSSATIDGVAWSNPLLVPPFAVKTSTGFTITMSSLSGIITSTLIVELFGSVTGTYDATIVSTGNKCTAVYTPNISTPTDTYASTIGKVNVTEINTTNKTISGTFSFTCTNTSLAIKTISNGKFTNAKYTELTTTK